RFLYLLELLVIQPGLAACSTGAAQSRGAAAPPFCVPTTHALATDPQFPSDCRKNHLARLEQTGCLFASMLQSLNPAALSRFGGESTARRIVELIHTPL